jgi:hypothetical protein
MKKLKKTKKKSCRHKWSDWKYGGSFEDGYTKTCTKCHKVKAR